MVDMITWTRAVMVTPHATAATISRKNTVPKIVTQPLLLDSFSENNPKNEEPAGKVAATIKIDEHIITDQPAMYPSAG
jgi:hypothetical protein